MIIDATELAAGTSIEADVCIVGAGPAGLTLARELRNQSFKVVLLESGGFKAKRSLKKLNEGETVGDPYPNPRWGRHRQVGGAANRWLVEIGGRHLGARYTPLDPIDFEKRDYMPYSGWPMTRSELEPYYERAQKHCGLGPYKYDTESWATLGEPIKFATGRVTTSMFQFGSKNVWTLEHSDVTQGANNITAIVNATCVELESDDGGTNLTGVRCVSPSYAQFFVRAKAVVLTIGCIETSRLLLASRARHRNGIGNQNDVVGRYFMDHPQSYLNVWTPSDRQLFEKMNMYDLIPQKGNYATMAKLTFSEDTLRREGLHNICWVLFPRRDRFMSPAFQSFFEVAHAVFHRQRPSRLVHHALTMAKGWKDLLHIGGYALRGQAYYPYISRGGWANVPRKSDMFTTVELFSLIEQAPDPSNRITLGDQLDGFGMPKVKIFWKFTDTDRNSIVRSRQLMHEEFTQSGLGGIEFAQDLLTSPSSVHPIGGGRMNNDPRYGVTDSMCRVHGVSNLYLASSAVFPTGGYANPTLTVAALACRIADNLKQQFAQMPAVGAALRETAAGN
jgi:choline dehydrogenase-like flavoprotein